MKLKDLMTVDVISIGPDASLKEAARRMIEAGVSGLPVTDGAGSLIGIITEADFVAGEADRRPERRARLLRFLFRDEEMPAHEKLVADVMTKEVIGLGPDADHAEAARVMEKNRIKRIPVVDDRGKVLGVVSRTDILRAFVRPDAEIIDEIQDHIIREVLWVDPRRVKVTCQDGNVLLEGTLETKSDADLIAELTRRLDGVVSVDDQLGFEIDNTKLEMVSPPVGMRPLKNW